MEDIGCRNEIAGEGYVCSLTGWDCPFYLRYYSPQKVEEILEAADEGNIGYLDESREERPQVLNPITCPAYKQQISKDDAKTNRHRHLSLEIAHRIERRNEEIGDLEARFERLDKL